MVTFFHKVQVNADLSELKEIHQRQLPGNELAILKAEDGDLFVKVTYPDATEKPVGSYSLEEMLPLLKIEASFG